MEAKITQLLVENSAQIFGTKIEATQIQFQKTRKDVAGDLTLVVFPFVKLLKTKPELVGEKIGTLLQEILPEISSFQVLGGFLNISFSIDFWKDQLCVMEKDVNYGKQAPSGKQMMVEYSSPNTNKPLHLGHVRNIFLGYSVAKILEANGFEVIKTQIINDRGIHICKSMLAWQDYAPKDANGKRETPQSTGMKGDHFVGKYYIEFDNQVHLEGFELAVKWKSENYRNTEIPQEAKEALPKLFEAYETAEDFKKKEKIFRKIAALAVPFTNLTCKVKEMLVKWENNDTTVRTLWKTMNGWVYDGFEATYNKMGVDFDKIYYESDTYLIGKKVVKEGLEKEVFYRKEDGSVWVDLTADGLDEKLLLRADGTAVYITQDIGTAIERFQNYKNLEGIIYTVGDEQNYHFKVLFLILKKLGYSWADACYHLSYGMVDLPDGKMKSREGKVVDADDLMDEVIEMATESTKERGQIEGLNEVEKKHLYTTIGLGGLKYFLLKVDPRKRMKFDPNESIDLNGNTGPFIQYAYARIQSLLSKVEKVDANSDFELDSAALPLVKQLQSFPAIVKEAGANYSPALIANYTYELVKSYNSFYQSNSVLREENEALRNARILVSKNIAKVIKSAMEMLGIEVPNRM